MGRGDTDDTAARPEDRPGGLGYRDVMHVVADLPAAPAAKPNPVPRTSHWAEQLATVAKATSQHGQWVHVAHFDHARGAYKTLRWIEKLALNGKLRPWDQSGDFDIEWRQTDPEDKDAGSDLYAMYRPHTTEQGDTQ